MDLPIVSVLMSTYNGEKYLEEQIDSILNQTGVKVKLLIRDDGSSDKTAGICRQYADRYDNITFYQGENLGVGRSFLELLRKSSKADYYSFADQDDVWLEDKLQRAVCMIKKAENANGQFERRGYLISVQELKDTVKSKEAGNIGILYASNQTLVDKELNYIEDRIIDIEQSNLYYCISNNVIYGCTMVMNHVCRMNIVQQDIDEAIIKRKNHDGWSLYHTFVTGEVIYDCESRILYRQHSNNVVGGFDINRKTTVMDRVNNLISSKHRGIRSRIASLLLSLYEEKMNDVMRHNLRLIRDANSFHGIRAIIRNREVRASFERSDLLLYLKGVLRWI